RLVPPLTLSAALRLYRAFLEDAARIYRAPALWESVLEAEPDPSHPEFHRLFTPPWRHEAQTPGDLGARLEGAFRRAFKRGPRSPSDRTTRRCPACASRNPSGISATGRGRR